MYAVRCSTVRGLIIGKKDWKQYYGILGLRVTLGQETVFTGGPRAQGFRYSICTDHGHKHKHLEGWLVPSVRGVGVRRTRGCSEDKGPWSWPGKCVFSKF